MMQNTAETSSPDVIDRRLSGAPRAVPIVPEIQPHGVITAIDSSLTAHTLSEDIETDALHDPTLIEKMNIPARVYRRARDSELITTAREEAAETRSPKKFINLINSGILTLSLVGYGFEIGPGNEWMVAKVGKEVIKRTAEEGNIPYTSLCAAAALGTVSLIEHTILGSAMYHNIKRYPKTINVIRRSALGKSNALRNSRDRNILGRFGNAFTVGASTVNLEDSVTDPTFISEDKGWKRTRSSAGLIATGSAAVAGAAGAGFQYAINHGHPEAAQNILDIASSALTWTAVFVGVRLKDYYTNKHAQPERPKTLLPEEVAEKITPTVAWAGVSAVALASAKGRALPDNPIVNGAIRSIVGKINKRGRFDLPTDAKPTWEELVAQAQTATV